MHCHSIESIDEQIKGKVAAFIEESWGSPIIVSRGKVHSADKLDGFVVVENDIIEGLITYYMEKGECEIVSLDSLIENQGIGSELIEKVIGIAKEHDCKRVWLITTNDNTKAIRFYQKRGFNLKEIHINAVEEARKIKPQIPLNGFDGIPIKHEIEFEILL